MKLTRKEKQRGEGPVGYVIILCLCVLVGIAAMTAFGTQVKKLWEGAKTTIEGVKSPGN